MGEKNIGIFEDKESMEELLRMNSEEILEKSFKRPWTIQQLQAISTFKIYQALEDITVLLGDIKGVMEGQHIKR